MRGGAVDRHDRGPRVSRHARTPTRHPGMLGAHEVGVLRPRHPRAARRAAGAHEFSTRTMHLVHVRGIATFARAEAAATGVVVFHITPMLFRRAVPLAIAVMVAPFVILMDDRRAAARTVIHIGRGVVRRAACVRATGAGLKSSKNLGQRAKRVRSTCLRVTGGCAGQAKRQRQGRHRYTAVQHPVSLS